MPNPHGASHRAPIIAQWSNATATEPQRTQTASNATTTTSRRHIFRTLSQMLPLVSRIGQHLSVVGNRRTSGARVAPGFEIPGAHALGSEGSAGSGDAATDNGLDEVVELQFVLQ
jgi:hypothetical protein